MIQLGKTEVGHDEDLHSHMKGAEREGMSSLGKCVVNIKVHSEIHTKFNRPTLFNHEL